MAHGEDKIAVLLIHGIGDQRPMATLRSFVEALLGPVPRSESSDASKYPLYWSKPDALSQSFELRRYYARGNRKRPPIDFYEYYWANKMEGNSLSHSLQWINNLLLRKPASVPPKLRKLWWLCWLILAITLASIVVLWNEEPVGAIGVVAALLLGAAKLITDLALRDWIGDAARYFDDRPANVGVRESIRRGGVELLKKVHDSGDYHRVIVVGHSLGSAIALDILYHYWTGAREKHGSVDVPAGEAREALEKMLKAGESSVGTVRQLQKAVWKELRANGIPWRVTDLVTLGSPLTHLPFLTGLDVSSFAMRLQQRELPKCPPILDGKGIAYWTRYRNDAGKNCSIGTLHHAACFAATRWTNLYFDHDGWFRGDPIGGPLRSLFGFGIDDRAVSTAHWQGRLNHLDYWRDDPRDAARTNAPLATLRAVLDFEEGFRSAAAKQKRTGQPGPSLQRAPPIPADEAPPAP